MTGQQKSDLIQKDPVTSARNFEHMVQPFIKDVMKSDEMPIRKIVDFFTGWNFNKGSHTHSLFWVRDAPQYEQNANEEIIHFIDKYMACKNDQ